VRTGTGVVVPLVVVESLLLQAPDESLGHVVQEGEDVGGPGARVGRVVKGAQGLEEELDVVHARGSLGWVGAAADHGD